jgi:hypothetical protein
MAAVIALRARSAARSKEALTAASEATRTAALLRPDYSVLGARMPTVATTLNESGV